MAPQPRRDCRNIEPLIDNFQREDLNAAPPHDEGVTILLKEYRGDRHAGALVPINERMVRDDASSVNRSFLENRRVGFLAEYRLLRRMLNAQNCVPVAHAVAAAGLVNGQ